MCKESAGLDDKQKCGISVYVDRNEFCANESVARVTRKVDTQETTRQKSLEVGKFSIEKICKFPEKSDGKLVWINQQNRNVDLNLTKFGTTENRTFKRPNLFLEIFY